MIYNSKYDMIKLILSFVYSDVLRRNHIPPPRWDTYPLFNTQKQNNQGPSISHTFEIKKGKILDNSNNPPFSHQTKQVSL